MPCPPQVVEMNSPAAFREVFGTMLQQVCHSNVHVTEEDANTAAYKYYKRQEYQDLHNSSVPIMLKEMQREVNIEKQASH